MSFKSGTLRVAKVIRWTGALLGAFFIVMHLIAKGSSFDVEIIFYCALVMVMSPVIAWVIEGFLEEDNSNEKTN